VVHFNLWFILICDASEVRKNATPNGLYTETTY